ncbi:hypothetical protein OF001_U400015 [Pseudomonas sp. OF001]|nr:hypothetical protein OF001_U400015 [Pseudomonas sp. OF001]
MYPVRRAHRRRAPGVRSGHPAVHRLCQQGRVGMKHSRPTLHGAHRPHHPRESHAPDGTTDEQTHLAVGAAVPAAAHGVPAACPSPR